MSRFVLFNGSVITRPGAVTKIDASQFQNIILGGSGTVGIIGEADGGPPRSLQAFSGQGGAAAIKNMFRSGDIVEAAQVLVDPGNDERIPTGAQQIVVYKINASTRASLVKAPHTFRSLDWGIATNNVAIALSAGTTSNGRVLTTTGLDSSGNLLQEISPSLGDFGKLAIQYTGAGSAATLTITATTLATTCTGATADNLSIAFADYPTLQQVITFIANTGKYTVSALVTNAASFDPTYLDAVSAIDIKTALTSLYATHFDVLDWVNKNSSLIFDDAASFTKGTVGPLATFVATAMTGGLRGTSANSDWVTAFSTLATLRINQVVPLASADATAAQGTFTFDSILAALTAHCKLMSSTLGRGERQGWSGANKTKAQLIAAANAQNTSAVVLSGQKPQKFVTGLGAIGFLPEWATALAMAGMRAGATLGEPLTWKFVNALGMSNDASWVASSDQDIIDLTLNGVTVVVPIQGQGFRIDKCVTTYTKADNDAFVEETIVQIWKAVSFTLRQNLEDRYTGRPGTLSVVRSVPGLVTTVLQRFKDEGAITDSVLADGTVLNAFRDITVQLQGDRLFVGVTISPTPGINYVLNSVVLIPASISA